MAAQNLTQDYLKSILNYDPETGVFTWRVSRGNQFTRPGMIAGGDDGLGYVRIELNGKGYRANRLAFLYMTGEMPPCDTDHIDRNPSNNAWANLRAVSTMENMRNKKRYATNKTGFTGVELHEKSGKYRATIRVAGKLLHLGVFNTLSDAAAAREAANIKYNFHPNHGRDL